MTVLMILVVIYHSALLWVGGWSIAEPVYSSDFLKYFAKWLNSFHIYGFTLVSGYVFYRMKYERKKYGEFLPFLVGKAKRLLVPYVFASLVWVIPFGLIFYRYTFVDIVKDYVFAAALSQLWFLVMLFGVFAASWLLSNLFVGNDIAGACIAIGAFFFGRTLALYVPNVFQIIRILTCLIYFYVGMKLSQGKAEFLRKYRFCLSIDQRGCACAFDYCLVPG